MMFAALIFGVGFNFWNPALPLLSGFRAHHDRFCKKIRKRKLAELNGYIKHWEKHIPCRLQKADLSDCEGDFAEVMM